MRYPHATDVRRTAVRAAHEIMAPLMLARTARMVRGRVPAGLERRAACYLALVAGGVPVMHLASSIGVARSYLKRGLAEIEDRRDDPRFDDLIDTITQEMRAC